MQSSRRQWYIVTVVLAVALVAALASRSNVSAPDAGDSPSPSASVTPSGTSLPRSSTSPTAAPAPAPTTYGDAVEAYAGHRIEFGTYCNASPSSATYKNGASIMLDNRSGDARYVTVGGVSHYLTGYGWKIVTLSSSTLPTTLYLGCGSAVNVGTILLQQ